MATTRLGIIGMSEGNGHPFSFSAIINGYEPAALARAGWQVIYDYVRRRDASEFGIDGFQITHAWTQDAAVTERLCQACRIPHVADSPEAMAEKVDAVIIARDDFEQHAGLALPFLKAGLSVFVDKPLTLDMEELRRFRPYLDSGKLMSCSAMRYARELDELRSTIEGYGDLKLVRGAVVNSWEKYGVHLLEAIWGAVRPQPLWVQAQEASHSSVCIGCEDGLLIQIDALGQTALTFQLDIWGSANAASYSIRDNFSMFRRMLWHFCNSIRTGEPAIGADDTSTIMRVLMAGNASQSEQRKVYLHELEL